jgi:L-histidine N-alpha-methyltransferase
VLDGLTEPFKELPPKHFYDTRGSELFDQICELPEYYPTAHRARDPRAHARRHRRSGRREELLELGSGYATKTRVLLDAMADAGTLRRYLPFDVPRRSCADRARTWSTSTRPDVHGVVGDFERHLDRVPLSRGPRTVAFLGGTSATSAGQPPPLLARHRRRMGPDDRLLLGTDLVKDPSCIRRAYER